MNNFYLPLRFSEPYDLELRTILHHEVYNTESPARLKELKALHDLALKLIPYYDKPEKEFTEDDADKSQLINFSNRKLIDNYFKEMIVKPRDKGHSVYIITEEKNLPPSHFWVKPHLLDDNEYKLLFAYNLKHLRVRDLAPFLNYQRTEHFKSDWILIRSFMEALKAFVEEYAIISNSKIEEAIVLIDNNIKHTSTKKIKLYDALGKNKLHTGYVLHCFSEKIKFPTNTKEEEKAKFLHESIESTSTKYSRYTNLTLWIAFKGNKVLNSDYDYKSIISFFENKTNLNILNSAAFWQEEITPLEFSDTKTQIERDFDKFMKKRRN